jgi:superfamily I DNA and RNA helicase
MKSKILLTLCFAFDDALSRFLIFPRLMEMFYRNPDEVVDVVKQIQEVDEELANDYDMLVMASLAYIEQVSVDEVSDLVLELSLGLLDEERK